MPLEISPVTSFSDFDQLIPLLWKAYSQPRVPLLYLTFAVTESTPEALAEGMSTSQKAFMHAHKDDSTSHYLKVVDTETRKIIAGSRWHIYEDSPNDNGPASKPAVTSWPEGEGRDFATHVLGQIQDNRRKRYKGQYMTPQMMFVHPDYRRKGAGKLMLDWGIHTADSLGLQCFTESPPSAVSFFESAEFKVVKVDVIDVRKKDASEEWQAMQRKFELTFGYAMWRPVQGKFIPGVTKMPF